MAYRFDKETKDLIIDGWETGIAPSPHKGIAMIKNGNISTETGEVTAAFSRLSQITSTGTASVSGTLTASSGDGTTVLASSTALSVGQWINVSAATVQIPKTTETISILGVGGGGSGGSADTNNIGTGGGGAGQFNSNSALVISATTYTVTVGAGGAAPLTGAVGVNGNTSSVTHVAGAIIATDLSAIGGGGGGGGTTTGNLPGVAGASGGGGGAGNGGAGIGGVGGVGSAGHNGGTGAANAGGGGGGATSAGTNATSQNGAVGGAGTASSISGASVTYAGGGGGGGNTAGAAGGAGGGGAGGGGGNATGTNATANTGGGGGGASHTSGGAQIGGNGGSGIVIISYPTGNITATGGTITTSGGNTIHTFTTSGTFTVTSVNTTQNLPAGNYFIDYAAAGPKVKIANSYDPSGTNPIVHGTSGTITFTTLGQLAKPVAKATETYNTSTTTLYRYYILDNTGLVWVNDTGNSLNWVLTNPSTTYYGTQAIPSGLTVLNGWVLVFAGEKIFAKPTTSLGAAWTEINGDGNSNLFSSTIPHFAYTGHQGRSYYTDGNYVGSIFPDTSIQTGGANIQSYASYAATGALTATVSAILSGSGPALPIGSSFRIPVVFSTDDFGTLPTAVTAGAVYWIIFYTASSGAFQVTGAAASSSVTLSNTPGAGDTSATLASAWTGQTFVQPAAFSNGDIRQALFTVNSTTISWVTPLTGTSTTTLVIGSGFVDIQTGAVGNQYFNTFAPTSSSAGSAGLLTTMTLSNQRVNLPAFETAQCMVEVGNAILIGCKGNVVYPWNQVDSTPSSLINLPEANVQSMITVNQMAYMFAGTNGNVYITDGSTASLVLNVPDYCAGIPGSPGTYIESNYYWEDSMYLRGRVYFSLRDQTSTKAGNCGGIWSFVPTQNLYIGQDTGIAIRLEAQNSYLTYNGGASILFPAQLQNAPVPLYWAGWYSDVTTPTYGIDYSNNGTLATSPTIIETDLIPVGTFLNKNTDSNIEYKLSSPLDVGATVTFNYRGDSTSAWTPGSTFSTESNGLSGIAKVNFQKLQWLQLQFILTPITSTADSNSFIRFKEVRVR